MVQLGELPYQPGRQYLLSKTIKIQISTYKLCPGEGHGFRKEETILDFYMEVKRFLQMNVLFAPE